MKKILSILQESEIIDKYLAGMSASALGEIYGLSRSGIGSIISRKGVKKIKKEKKIKPPSIRPIRLTKQVKELILKEYNEGSRISDLSKKYNIAQPSIRNWFAREGLKTRFDKKGDKKNEKIIELHNKGLNVKQIQLQINATYLSVIQTLWRNDLRPNPAIKIARKCIDENYFNEINTDRRAYFFGLLCADGSVLPKWSRVFICLKESDKYLIQELKDELSSDAPMVYFKHRIGKGYGYRISFHSKKMVSDLVKHGMKHQKSKGFCFPQIDKKYFWPFLRGYIDGNGSVSKDGMRLAITAPPLFNEGLRIILKQEYDINCCLSDRQTNTDLIIVKRDNLSFIRSMIYDDADIWMKRKKNNFFNGNYLYDKIKKEAS